MSENEEERAGRFAVPGAESAESEETLSPDEKGTEEEPVPPPTPPSGPPRPRRLRWPFGRR